MIIMINQSSFNIAKKNSWRPWNCFFLVNSGFYVGNYVSLGKTYLKLKNKEEAKKWFQKAAEYPSENEKDDQVLVHTYGKKSTEIFIHKIFLLILFLILVWFEITY